jgi:uncharacterized flavoprotein (TIGR03862 family)
MREKFAGQPLKPLAVSFGDRRVQGEAVISAAGIEGGAIYALAAPIRDAIAARGAARIMLDLNPALDEKALAARLSRPRQGRSLGNTLRREAGLSPSAIALLHETGDITALDAAALAARIKAVPLTLTATAPIDRAISTAGGVRLDAVDEGLMLRALPGVFVAGEMLDWEAPTGGYLLQASFATGRRAAAGIMRYLTAREKG